MIPSKTAMLGSTLLEIEESETGESETGESETVEEGEL